MSVCHLPITVVFLLGLQSTRHSGSGPHELLFIAVTVFRLSMQMPANQYVYHNLIHKRKEWVFLNPSPMKVLRQNSVKNVSIPDFLFNMLKLRINSSCELRRPLLAILSLSWV